MLLRGDIVVRTKYMVCTYTDMVFGSFVGSDYYGTVCPPRSSVLLRIDYWLNFVLQIRGCFFVVTVGEIVVNDINGPAKGRASPLSNYNDQHPISPGVQCVQQRGFQERTKTPRLSERKQGVTKTKDRNEVDCKQTAPGHLPK